MGQYAYLVMAIGISAFVLVVLYLAKSRYPSKSSRVRSWSSYLLLWPLIFDADVSKRQGRFLTTREWLGWAVVAGIILFGIIFSGRR